LSTRTAHRSLSLLIQIEVNLPTNYVSKDTMEARFDRIEDMIMRLGDKIDGKADK
jgi:hypothetical protein